MEAPGARDPKINILIVDDRPENIAALKAILADPSYRVLTATNGEDALRCVHRNDLALILLDVFMAGMDGYEVASLIKGRKKYRHLPIIFLTAMAKDIDHIFKAYSIGAVDYIQKPLEPHIVKAKVSVFAELYRNKQRIKQQEYVIRQKELKEKEYQLLEVKRAGERRYQDLVEGIDHGFVWSADPESLTFNYVSPRAELILGYPLDQWQEEQGFWSNHLHPDDRDWVLDVFRQAKKGRDIGHDHRFITAEGGTVWLHTGVRLARKGEGVGYELRGLSVDITHLKAIESALRDAVQSRDEFLSIASHELKTPITPLKLQVQQFERLLGREDGQGLDREKLIRFVQLWNRQLDKLTRLVEDLVDVSRINTGQLTIETEVVDLSELVHEVTERYRAEASAAGCEYRLSIEENVFGRVDRTRVEQVLVNLLTNALKYAPGCPLTIELGVMDQSAVLKVQDSGKGIPKEKQERIFERYERAVDSKGVTGLGLGLYISKQILEAHGGSIWVESEPGNGSSFFVKLPLRENAGKKSAA